MTPEDQLLTALDRVPVVGILRGCPTEHVVAVGEAAAAAGIAVLEVTLDSPTPQDSITRLAAALPEVVVGAGTVHATEDVEAAAVAGAAFIVTPFVSLDVVRAAADHNLPCLPGAATPTEIRTALEAGAVAVKLFPASELGGPDYLAAVSGPLGRPPLVPTGGVGVGNGAEYLAAGARAIGVGGSVFPRAALVAGDFAAIGIRATELMRSLA